MSKVDHRKRSGGCFSAPAAGYANQATGEMASRDLYVSALAHSYARWRCSLRPSAGELWLSRTFLVGLIVYPVLGFLDAATSVLVQAAGASQVYETNWLIAPLISVDGGIVGPAALSAKALLSVVPVIGLLLVPRLVGAGALRGRGAVAAGFSLVVILAIANAGFVAAYNYLLYLNVLGDSGLASLLVALAGFQWLFGFGLVFGCVVLAGAAWLDGRRR